MPDDMERDKPHWRRIAWWVVPPAVVVLGTVVFLGVVHEDQDSGQFHVGTCFQAVRDTGIVAADGLRQVTGRAKVVDCGAAHDAQITRTARLASDCAAEGVWLESRQQIYCVKVSG